MTSALSGIGQGALVVLVGVAIAGGGLYLYDDAQSATENAVERDATVVSSEVVETRVDGGEASRSHDAWYADVEYRYTYEGQRYRSSNLCPGAGSSCEPAQTVADRSQVRQFVSQYPEDATVTAYVPADEPESAYLVDASESATQQYFVLVGVGAFVGLLGLVGVAGGVRDLASGD